MGKLTIISDFSFSRKNSFDGGIVKNSNVLFVTTTKRYFQRDLIQKSLVC